MKEKLVDIDLVYTWVNPTDSEWANKRAQYAGIEVGEDFAYRAGAARFRDNNELKYSLRSVEKYLPFIRRIFVLHGGCAPDWLKHDTADLVFVPQDDILPSEISPCYQSDAIEAFLYKISGLSENYIYSNDDIFFAHDYKASDFFDESGRAVVALAPRLAGEGRGVTSDIYRQTEINAGKALAKKIKLPKPITASKYPFIPVFLRCLIRGKLPINTMAHIAHPFCKSLWPEFHKTFAEEINTLCQSRFRSASGFTINMMACHYAVSINKAVFDYQNNLNYIGRSTSSKDTREQFRQAIFAKDSNIKSFCLNDEISDDDDGWESYTKDILEHLFPKPSRWEQ